MQLHRTWPRHPREHRDESRSTQARFHSLRTPGRERKVASFVADLGRAHPVCTREDPAGFLDSRRKKGVHAGLFTDAAALDVERWARCSPERARMSSATTTTDAPGPSPAPLLSAAFAASGHSTRAQPAGILLYGHFRVI